MAKRSPEEVLQALDALDADDAIDAEMQRVLEMTPEEREDELREAGLDVEAERVKAAEFLERLVSDAPTEPTEKNADEPSAEPAAWVTQAAPPSRARPAARWAVLLAAALASAATGGGVLYAVGHRAKPIDNPVEVPPLVPTVTPPPAPPPQDTQSAPLAAPPRLPGPARDIPVGNESGRDIK